MGETFSNHLDHAPGAFPVGGGALGDLIRTRDWSNSPLGHPDGWSPVLRTTLSTILPAGAQIVMFWGSEFVALYNDAYAPTIGDKHPHALGRPAREYWSELWDDLEPLLLRVRDGGETVWAESRPFYIERHGHPETVYFDISYSPVRNDDGAIEGVVCLVKETTAQVLSEQRVRESEARFRNMADHAPMMMWVTEPDGRCSYLNRLWYEFTGQSEADAEGYGWLGAVHPDDRGWSGDIFLAANARQEPFRLEYRLQRADGSYRWAIDAASPRFGPDGAFLGYIGSVIDIEDRREIEDALRASEAHLSAMLGQAAAGVAETDLDGCFLNANDRFCAMVGRDREALTRLRMQDITHPLDLRDNLDLFRRMAVAGEAFEIEKRYIRPDGEIIWVSNSVSRILGPDGGPGSTLAVSVDITDRKRTEQALREERQTLEMLNRVASQLSGELDLQKVVQLVTDESTALTGAEFGAFFYNVVDDGGGSYMLYTLSGAEPSQFDFGMPRATAVFHPTFAGEGPVRSDDITRDPRYGQMGPHFGMPAGHLPVCSYLALPVVGSAGDVIGGLFFGHAEPGRFTARHEELMVGVAAQAAIAMDNARLYQAAQTELASRMKAEQELRLLNETLEARVAEEVARRAETEEALRQAQKMETLGQLTGGVAHDFNNLLQIVSGNIGLIQRALPEDAAKLRRAADNAARGAERAAVLTQRLLAFSRRQPLAPKPIDPNRLVGGMTDLLHRTLGETIAVETVLAGGLWPIEADPNQLENAILNLAINARDAMPDGGKLTLETCNTHLDRAYTVANAEVAAGQYVCISVSDTGAGMDEDTLARAFEPFFTTKEVGRGTGLGLSMVYGYVKQSGGHLKLYSEPGHGTSVKIYLPRLVGEGPVTEAGPEPIAPEGADSETILVCEDDADVRAYTVEVLRELGYRVVEAEDGPRALARLGEHPEIDLLFTDVVLPGGMTGAVLAAEARKLRPDLRILFTTGYARNAIVHHGRLDAGVELITKPFSYADLAARVRDMLDGQA